jgi:hypothetical protein
MGKKWVQSFGKIEFFPFCFNFAAQRGCSTHPQFIGICRTETPLSSGVLQGRMGHWEGLQKCPQSRQKFCVKIELQKFSKFEFCIFQFLKIYSSAQENRKHLG